MKVSELIKKLQEFDWDLDVSYSNQAWTFSFSEWYHSWDRYYNYFNVEEIKNRWSDVIYWKHLVISCDY